jgi:hypothetical protein
VGRSGASADRRLGPWSGEEYNQRTRPGDALLRFAPGSQQRAIDCVEPKLRGAPVESMLGQCGGSAPLRANQIEHQRERSWATAGEGHGAASLGGLADCSDRLVGHHLAACASRALYGRDQGWSLPLELCWARVLCGPPGDQRYGKVLRLGGLAAAALGAWLILSPWIVGFVVHPLALWSAVIPGAAIVGLGV